MLNQLQIKQLSHCSSDKLRKVYRLSADLLAAGDFVDFLGLVSIAELERFLASLL